MAKRIDLLDPDRAALEQVLPAQIERDVIARLLAPIVLDDEPRPRIASRRTYVFGIFVVPLVISDENRVCFQEVDFILTRDVVVTVRKTLPDGGQPFAGCSDRFIGHCTDRLLLHRRHQIRSDPGHRGHHRSRRLLDQAARARQARGHCSADPLFAHCRSFSITDRRKPILPDVHGWYGRQVQIGRAVPGG